MVLRKIGTLLDVKTWLDLQNVYEKWHDFPPDRLTLTGSRESGRMFHPLEFPPASVNFSVINLDRVYGGPSVPPGGACELVASYLTYVPRFGEKIRVINLTGQYVTAKQVSQLFSESLSPRLPNLQSVSLRIFNRHSNPRLYEMSAPPRLEHLEVCLELLSPQLTRRMLQSFLPLMHKVKHLGWYRFFAGEDDISTIIRTPLESLKIIEVMQETLPQFGTYPSASMPSLERLIVHNHQFSYSVNLKQIYESIWQPFSFDHHMLVQQNAHKNEFSGRTAVLTLTDHAEQLEQIKRRPSVHKVRLNVIHYWPWDVLINEVLPILSTLRHLDEVVINTREILPYMSSYEKRTLMGHLHEQFQFTAVRQLEFDSNAEVASIDPYITFMRLFPKLDTLVNPPMQCFKDVQICKGLRRESLLCLRKLVVCKTHDGCINDISRCVLRWKNLDAFLIKYHDDDTEWMTVLIDKLAKHRNLRHLCVIAGSTQIIHEAGPLPTREKIEELAGAWSDRDWISMFFIATYNLGRQVNFIIAIHLGHGTIKFVEANDQPFTAILHSFPQFYTLFWQYTGSKLYPK